MTDGPGLRERKKQQTRRTIAAIATRMFAERGFDQVTVAEIASPAEVSTKTVFNYFPTKEDLVLGGREEVDADLVRIVQSREVGESVLAAVRRHTLAVAERMRAVPPEQRAAFRKVLQSAPTVQARWREMLRQHEDALARLLAEETGATADDVTPGVVASVLGVLGRLAYRDMTGWPDGRRRSPAEIGEAIDRSFELLGRGLAEYGVRKGEPPVPPSRRPPRGTG
jgi:AcrR family transcriptional regulator